MFVWGFPSHLRFFTYLDVSPLPVKAVGLQVLTYTLHSWPLSNEVSLICHTYCDTSHPFIKVISKDLHAITFVAECLALELSRPVLTNLLCPNWNRTLISRMLGEGSTTKPLIWYWASCVNLLQLTDWKYYMYILKVQWRFRFFFGLNFENY